MSTVTPERIDKAVRHATEAFWNRIAVEFFEVTSGDVSPDAAFHLHNAMTDAVEWWLEANQPSRRNQP